jgi:two-component system response regulator MprA
VEDVRVLLVDDDARSARALARLLEDDGFVVEVATDGAEALRRLAREPAPEVLVTDLLMPEVDGLSLARKARESAPKMPVFFVTCYPELLGGAHDGLDPPAQVFTKPIEYFVLATAMHDVTNRRPLARVGTSG